jgi:hypothetical protein
MLMPEGTPFQARVDAEITMVDGEPQVKPDPIRVKRQGHVTWRCSEGDWEIEMERQGPLSKGRKVAGAKGAQAGDDVLDDGHQTGEGGDPDSPKGRHKYVIRVRTEDGWKERDPEVVVGPERTP